MGAKSIRALPALASGILLAAGAGESAPANRLYIKQNGVIAFAIDPSGHAYSRSTFSAELYGGTIPGFLFREQGVPIAEVFDALDTHWFGALADNAGMVYANFSTVPFRASGSLVFYYHPTSTTKTGMLEVDNGDQSINMRGNYVKDFGYRKCSKNLQASEWTNLINAWVSLDNTFYPGSKGSSDPADPNAVGGVSYWDKQQQIHRSFGRHSAGPMGDYDPAFLPWHREFLNRLEDLLRQKDPLLSVPYWDWTSNPTDPAGTKDGVALIGGGAAGHMGWGYSAIGDPFTGFYNAGTLSGSRQATNNPADPPQYIQRHLVATYPVFKTDDQLLANSAYNWFLYYLETDHNGAHVTLSDGDNNNNIGPITTSAEDPIFFFIHSNVDRIWAKWQRADGHPERMAQETVYGSASSNWPNNWPGYMPGMTHHLLDPWAGGAGMAGMGTETPLRPWTSPDNQAVSKSYVDPSVMIPRNYEDIDGNYLF